MDERRYSRRRFLGAGSLAAGLAMLPGRLKPVPITDATASGSDSAVSALYPNAGRVAIVYHPQAVLGLNNVDAAVVQAMFDQGIMQLTGITASPAAALASLFPGLTTAKKIAIKPNLINSSVPTRKELVKALVARLVQMLGGFPPQNISLYEQHSFASSGYTQQYFGQPVNLVYDNTFPDNGHYIYCNGKNRPYSQTLFEADYLVNMPVLKDHSCSADLNITLSFKNHMGTVNPGGSLGIHCDKKAILDIMASSVMLTKQRLVLLDALYAIYNGGPGGQPQATPMKILLSQDPVCIDAQGRIMINALRTANHLAAKNSGYIDQAAAPPYSLGIADPAQMTVLTVNLPVELSSFQVTAIGDRVTVRWTTERETNNAGFHVERSADGVEHWERLTFIPGAGSSSARHDYRWEDPLGPELREAPVLFYRLCQVDFDGSTEYLPAAEVRLLPEEGGWHLEPGYPNPCSTFTHISVQLPRPAGLLVEVFDMRGALVCLLADGPHAAGAHRFTWHPRAAGTYLCRAVAEGRVREIRIAVVP